MEEEEEESSVIRTQRPGESSASSVTKPLVMSHHAAFENTVT